MDRTTETISSPYETVVTRQDGAVVEVTIRAIGDAELTRDTLQTAHRELVDRLRREEMHRVSRARQSEEWGPSLSALADAYRQSRGRMTPEYLATLAGCYTEGATTQHLADTIGKPVPTLKGHLVKARKDGYLSAGEPGRSGGELTDKSREVLGGLLATDTPDMREWAQKNGFHVGQGATSEPSTPEVSSP